MARRKKKKSSNTVLIIIIIGVLIGLLYFYTRPKLQVVKIVSEIDNYNYYLESNQTSLYNKKYNELKKILSNSEINEEEYAKLVSELFSIDYYTLTTKITNKNIGGVQFIHSNLKDKFISQSSNTVYKYVKNNLYGNRKQELPEVNKTEIKEIQSIKYNKNTYIDNNGYEVVVKLEYVKDYDYPKEITIKLIHEDKKLSIVEIK